MFDFFNRKKMADLQHRITILEGINESRLQEIIRLRNENDVLCTANEALRADTLSAASANARRRNDGIDYLKQREASIKKNSDTQKDRVRREEATRRNIHPHQVVHHDNSSDLTTGILLGSIMSDNSGYGSSDGSYSSSCDSGSYDSGSSGGGCD